MRVVDDAIITALRAAGITVHDGDVPTERDGTVVTAPLPYLVYFSNVGDDVEETMRIAGMRSARSVFFSWNCVGADRNQAKAVAERARDAVNDKRLVVPGWKVDLLKVETSQRVRRDDDAVRPDGAPLFYGVDEGSVVVRLKHQP